MAAATSISLSGAVPPYMYQDNDTALTQTLDFIMSAGGMTSDGNLKADDREVTRAVDQQAVAGHTSDHLSRIEHLLHNKLVQYENHKRNTLIVNDLENLNRFANETVGGEHARLTHLLRRSKTNLEKTRQSYLSLRYQADKARFWTYMVQLSLFFLVLFSMASAAVVVGSLNRAAWVWLALLLSSCYLFIFILTYRTSLTRRNNDWSKFTYMKASSAAA